jgi:hypothetical protein
MTATVTEFELLYLEWHGKCNTNHHFLRVIDLESTPMITYNTKHLLFFIAGNVDILLPHITTNPSLIDQVWFSRSSIDRRTIIRALIWNSSTGKEGDIMASRCLKNLILQVIYFIHAVVANVSIIFHISILATRKLLAHSLDLMSGQDGGSPFAPHLPVDFWSRGYRQFGKCLSVCMWYPALLDRMMDLLDSLLSLS